MVIIASHPYIIVTRQILENKQFYIENEQFLHLYENGIVSHTDQFALHDIWDLSYKASNVQSSFLYLHTNRGLFAFHVRKDPNDFISLYWQLQR